MKNYGIIIFSKLSNSKGALKMSHLVKVKVEFKDLEVLKAACKKVGASYVDKGVAKFFDGSSKTGALVRLKNWSYPVVVTNGEAYYDNYNGHWGNISELNALKQNYSIEAIRKTAEQMGYSCMETDNGSGQVELVVERLY